jgi:hypothetical protein
MIRKYRFNAPVYEQYAERTSGLEVIHFGGQEFEMEDSLALDPRLELVGDAEPEPEPEPTPLASLAESPPSTPTYGTS